MGPGGLGEEKGCERYSDTVRNWCSRGMLGRREEEESTESVLLALEEEETVLGYIPRVN